MNGHRIVTIPLRFALVGLDARISFDAAGAISGFWLAPASRAAPPPVALAGDEPWSETAIQVGEGERALPGTLTRPHGDGPFAAVVLVHGSGPQDRDSTLGPNKPLRDLAHGLAGRGIASLRYDKRTFSRPQDFADGDFDVDDEVTDDALHAIETLRTSPAIDPARVFIAGHSLGGLIAPRIAQRAPRLAGVVLLAAPARTLDAIYLEQIEFLARRGDGIDAREQAQLEAERVKAATLATLDPRSPAADNLLGLPARYWIDLRGYDAVATARSIAQPLLIVQGGRDYQVTASGDFARWRAAFDGDARVQLREYPALNHLLIAGEGEPSPADYARAGSVDAALIDDIAAWIGATPVR